MRSPLIHLLTSWFMQLKKREYVGNCRSGSTGIRAQGLNKTHTMVWKIDQILHVDLLVFFFGLYGWVLDNFYTNGPNKLLASLWRLPGESTVHPKPDYQLGFSNLIEIVRVHSDLYSVQGLVEPNCIRISECWFYINHENWRNYTNFWK